MHHHKQQIVKIQRVALLELLLICLIGRDDLFWRIAVVQVGKRIEALVLRLGNTAAEFPRGKHFFVEVQVADDLFEQGLLIRVVIDHKRALIA